MLSFKRIFFLQILTLCILDFTCGLALKDYLRLREKAIEDEEATMFGSNLKLDRDEVAANQCLISIKRREIAEGYQNLSRFWPARDFLEVRQNIERTETFKILRQMPKAGNIHTHNGRIASIEFVYENLTTMPNLYVCLDNNTVQFRFFETPNCRSCNWLLMKDLWENHPKTIAYIKEYLTLPKLSTPGYNTDMMWAKWNQMWQAIQPIYLYRPAYEKYIYRCLEEMYEDKIMYWEVRIFSERLYELNGTVHDPILAIEIMKRVVDEFVATHPGFLGAKSIFSVARQATHEEFAKEVEIFRRMKSIYPNFVVGFDISNYEDRSHTNLYFIDQLLELNKETSFYFHAGETAWWGSPIDENLFEAVLLNTKRICYGFALLKYPKLVEMIKEKDIAMELTAVASQMGYIYDLRNHPASHFFAKNLSVIVASDNPGFWHGGLSYDYYETFIGIMSQKADLRSLKQLAINSINYSAMSTKEKEAAFKIWNESWSKFVKYLAYEYKCDRTN